MLRFLILLVLFSPAICFADTTDDLHLQTAFIYAKKKQWDDAVAQAQAGHSEVLVKYFIWEYLKDPESDAKFRDISTFIEQNPNWPDQEALVRRAEAALLSETPDDDELDKWYAAHPPKTLTGKKRSMGKDELHELIRESWVEDDYTKIGEAKILAHYGDVLRPEDHAKRIDRLLWENHLDAAKRLLPYAPAGKRKLFEARMSLMRDSSRAPRDVSNVPAAFRNDSGLLYDRMKYRARHSDKDGVRELLLEAPATVPYPDKWWPYRDRAIREAINENNISIAEKLIAHHGQTEDSVQGKEALWLKGWVELEFARKPKQAYETFDKLYDGMETPFGKARTAYWAGRAAEAANMKSRSWYLEAAKYNTTFYGQLALTELDDHPVLSIDADDSDTSSSEKNAFAKRELVKLVQALARAKQSNLAGKFILYMVDTAKNAKEAVLAAQLGRSINRIDIGVRASKKALRDGVVALDSGYPVIKMNSDTAGLEKTYVLALMRQESEFFADAISGSGALGLMQLLPGTAKEVAHKNDVAYSGPDRLFDPNYNMRIGTLYLSNLVSRFDGSYVLATASYNAGPGRVRQWMGAYGSPTRDPRVVTDWIEAIPFSETRNYVQHVMGNMQVYRYVLNGKKPIKMTLADDLGRGLNP